MEPRLHNLPAPTNSFIGRGKELSALAALLSRARLITLVGMSGIGKTRLALELARQLVNAPKRRHPFPDGVWFVSLESLSDASQIIAAIGEVLRVQWQEGVVPLKTLTAFSLLVVCSFCWTRRNTSSIAGWATCCANFFLPLRIFLCW